MMKNILENMKKLKTEIDLFLYRSMWLKNDAIYMLINILNHYLLTSKILLTSSEVGLVVEQYSFPFSCFIELESWD
jgi:hypothetical protein